MTTVSTTQSALLLDFAPNRVILLYRTPGPHLWSLSALIEDTDIIKLHGGDPLLTRSMGSLIDATILPGGTETSGDVIRKTWISLPVAPLRNNRAVRYIAVPLALCP